MGFTFVTDKKETSMERLKHSLFRNTVGRYYAEANASNIFIKFCLVLHFVVLLFCSTSSCFEIDRSLWSRTIAITGIVATGLMWIVKLCLVLQSLNSQSNEFLTRMSIYMTIAFTYIVYPLMNWGIADMASASMDHRRKGEISLALLLVSICVSVSGFMYIGYDMITANTMISPYCMATYSTATRMLAYIVTLLSIILTQVGANTPSTSLTLSLEICSDVLLASMFSFLFFRPPFWDRHMNTIYTTSYFGYFMTKVLRASTQCSTKHLTLDLVILIVIAMLYRFVENIYLKVYKVDINAKNLNPKRRLLGVVMMNLMLENEISYHVTKEEIDLRYFYAGQLNKFRQEDDSFYDDVVEAPTNSSEESRNTTELRNSIRRSTIRYLRSQEKKDVQTIKLLLLLELTRTVPNLCEVRMLLNSLSHHKRQGVVSQFEQYHYRKLYENKLDALYKGKIKSDGGGNFGVIMDIYTQDCAKSADSSIEYVDVCCVFRDAEFHKAVTEHVTEQVQVRLGIFEKLFSEKIVPGTDFLQANKKTLKLHNKIMRIYDELDLLRKTHASYVYPMFIYYFSLIRNSIRKAEQLFQIYKRKLTRIARLNEDRQRGSLDIDANSVGLIISLDQDKIGEILATTLNYFEYLGQPSNGRVVGRNINNLFPGDFQNKHTHLMRHYEKYDVISMEDRSLFMNGFDGFLRNTYGTVKIVPDLRTSVQACTLLTFVRSQGSAVVLIDDDMNILNAEKDFWDIFDSSDCNAELISMKQLSREIVLAVNLLKAFPAAEAHLAEEVPDLDPAFAELRISVLKALRELRTANEQGGIRFRADQDSPFLTAIGRRNIVAQISFSSTGLSGFTKLNIRIDNLDRPADGRKQKLKQSAEVDRDNSEVDDESSSKARSNNGRHFKRGKVPYNAFALVGQKTLEEALSGVSEPLETYRTACKNHPSVDDGMFKCVSEDIKTANLDHTKAFIRIEEIIIINSFIQRSNLSSNQPENGPDTETKNQKTMASKSRMIHLDVPVVRHSITRNLTLLTESPIDTPSPMRRNCHQATLNSEAQELHSPTRKQPARKIVKTNRHDALDAPPTHGIALASSNLIGKILNKVMAKNGDQGSEASSSVATSRGDLYIMLKQVELSDKRGLRLKWLFIHLAFKWLWIVLILIACFYFTASTRDVISNSKERLDTISDLIELQYTLRVNVNTFYRQWLALVTVFESDLENRLIPISVDPLSSETKRTIFTNLNGMSKGSYLRFTNERTAKSALGQSTSSVHFELKRWENTLFDVEYHYLQNTTTNVERILPVTFQLEYAAKSELMEAVRSNTIMSYRSLALLKEIEPYMIGKEPPFNMPEEVANKLAQALLLSLTLISNCLGSLISEVDFIVNELAELVLVKDASGFLETYGLSIGLLIGLFLLFVTAFIAGTFKIQAGLKNSILMYQLLKVNEAQSLVGYYVEMTKKLNKFALDESVLIFQFLRIKTRSTAMINYNAGRSIISKRDNKTSIISVARAKNNLRFQSVRYIICWGAAIGILLAVIISFLGTIGLKLKQFIATEEFYINSYRVLSHVNSQYLVFYSMAALGNFIKIDGKYPEDARRNESQSITYFANFWLSHAAQLPDYIDQPDIDKLNLILYKEVCSRLANTTFSETVIMSRCLEHIPARNGLLTFLKEEENLFQATIDSELRQDSSFLNRTKSRFERTPLVELLLQPSVLSTFQLHHSLVGIFRAHIDGAIHRSLMKQTNAYENKVKFINTIGVVGLILVLFGFTKIMLSSVELDTKIVLETAVTIRPNVFKLNPMIQLHMRNTYSNFSIK